MLVLPDREIVVVDIETTEVALAETASTFPEPVEIGAVRVTGSFEVLDEFQMLIRPHDFNAFTEFSANFTGISRADLEKAELFDTAWREFAEFTKFNRYRLLSWGAPFDYPVLKLAYLHAGLGYPHAFPMIDAISIVYKAAGEWGFRVPRWSLEEACKRFGVAAETKHRALGGAYACVSVLRAILIMEESVEIDL